MGGPEPGQLLVAQRTAAVARVEALTADLGAIIAAAEGANGDDEHDPEGATIAYERARVAALLDQSRRQLADLDRAIDRLAEGRYGACEGCGDPIDPERLRACPGTTRCIACAGATGVRR